MKKFGFFYFILLFTLIFASCEKDDDSEDGATGPQGPAGTNGLNGTIELVVKEITIYQGDWISYNSSTNSNDSAAVSIPEINQAIVDSGAVFCYRKVGNNYWIMPNNNFYGIGTYVFQHYYYNGKLVFTCNANYVGGNNLGTETFKVIIATGQLKLAGQHVDWNDYNAVLNNFKLLNRN